ncbi:MAG: hypothetical protein SFW64_08335 [Alphaproteobacteria bacterium]|nr:hypothetical protein [Alphaproteobacteria bacterium]
MMTLRAASLCRLLVALLMLGTGLLVLLPGGAEAQQPAPVSTEQAPTGTPSTGDIKTTDASGDIVSCGELDEVKGGKLLGKIVPCLIYTINQSTVKFAAAMVEMLRPLLFMFLTLVVVLFGVRMLAQEPEIHKHGFLLLVKIAIVAIILADLGNITAYDGSGGEGKLIPAVYDIMNESQAIVAGAINTTNLHCNVADFQGENTPRIWAMMDCVLGKLYGFTTGHDPNTGKETTNMLLVSSVLGLMTGFFFGGAWGVAIFLGMLGTLVTVLMMVMRTALGFLSSYLVISLLLILSPLLLPLAFLKITAQYFEGTWRTILAAFLTPVLITAYSMFAMILYDQILFAPESAVQTLFKYENIKAALKPSRPACSHPITNNPTELRGDGNSTSGNPLSSPMLKFSGNQTSGGGNDPCSLPFSFPNLDAEAINGLVAPDGNLTGPADSPNRKEAYEKMFYQLLNLFVVAYLIHNGLGSLTGLLSQILGKRSAIAANDALFQDNFDFKEGSRRAFDATINRFKATDGNKDSAIYKSGADFLRGVPTDIAGATKDSISAFLEGMHPRDQ